MWWDYCILTKCEGQTWIGWRGYKVFIKLNFLFSPFLVDLESKLSLKLTSLLSPFFSYSFQIKLPNQRKDKHSFPPPPPPSLSRFYVVSSAELLTQKQAWERGKKLTSSRSVEVHTLSQVLNQIKFNVHYMYIIYLDNALWSKGQCHCE